MAEIQVSQLVLIKSAQIFQSHVHQYLDIYGIYKTYKCHLTICIGLTDKSHLSSDHQS